MMIGRTLSHYAIEKRLGAGGMGEVYRARDTRLDRLVAVKILAESARLDPVRRARFETEARTVAALSHPNICALYDVGRHEGVDFLVMELLDGETLAARLERGPMDLAEALAVAIQIAAALDAAHRRGIVHRDLKPGNIMLIPPGVSRRGPPQIKLLDFGLARLLSPEAGEEHDGQTATAPLTRQGEILGTLPYMAPEQLEGEQVDARTDLFAFGAMLHEMLTGRRAFEGSNQASLIGSILRGTPPPIGEVAPSVPPELEHLIGVCLAKNPEDRWSSAHDVLLQLNRIAATRLESASSSAEPRLVRRPRLAWGGAAAAAAVAIALTVVLWTDHDAPSLSGMDLSVLSILPPERTTLAYSEAPGISPDGRQVAFVAIDEAGTSRLYVRGLDTETARPLPGTDGALQPFWSPDGRDLGFFAQGHLKTVSLSGGAPRTLARAPVPRGGTWNGAGLILFVPLHGRPPLVVPSSGGDPVVAPIREGEIGRRLFPTFLPDGRHYLYLKPSGDRDDFALRVGSLDSTEDQELVRTTGSGGYAPPGYLLFRREATLLAQPFDPRARRLTGAPRPVAENVGYQAVANQSLFSASGNGVIAYQASTPGAELVWFDRLGRRLGGAVRGGDYNTLCVMPDGTTVVYEAADPLSGVVDIWSLDSTTGRSSRLTYASNVDFFPVCSPDGQEIVYASVRDAPPDLFRVAIASPGSDRAVLRSPVATLPTHWSPDGRVVYSVLRPQATWGQATWGIEVLDLASGRTEVLVASPADEGNGRLSPDGRWLAYTSDETGRHEVYVQPVPPTGGKWQLSREGGLQPQWRGDGSELFYIAPDRKLIAIEIKTSGSELVVGKSQVLFDTRITGWDAVAQSCRYAASADGERFLVTSATEAPRPISVVLNWTKALED